jgi:restriction endonuclease S subunit
MYKPIYVDTYINRILRRFKKLKYKRKNVLIRFYKRRLETMPEEYKTKQDFFLNDEDFCKYESNRRNKSKNASISR